MSYKLWRYPATKEFGAEYDRVHNFFKKYGSRGFNGNWHWGRWEWLIGHSMLDAAMLPSIGVFEEAGEIVGVATHDMRKGQAYLLCDPSHEDIKPDMLRFAEGALAHEGQLTLFVDERDEALKECVQASGFARGDGREVVLKLDAAKGPYDIVLPEGYRISDYETDLNIPGYIAVMWKGFGHGDHPREPDDDDLKVKPHEDASLEVFTVRPDGEYASHCGMWHLPGEETAYVEPVATIPACRRMGLGKAAVYEGCNRCFARGAASALVISDQAFYHDIGFAEHSVHGTWTKEY